MINDIKVSFDFDATLSRYDVEEYATELIQRNIDVYICTSRFSAENTSSK